MKKLLISALMMSFMASGAVLAHEDERCCERRGCEKAKECLEKCKRALERCRKDKECGGCKKKQCECE